MRTGPGRADSASIPAGPRAGGCAPGRFLGRCAPWFRWFAAGSAGGWCLVWFVGGVLWLWFRCLVFLPVALAWSPGGRRGLPVRFGQCGRRVVWVPRRGCFRRRSACRLLPCRRLSPGFRRWWPRVRRVGRWWCARPGVVPRASRSRWCFVSGVPRPAPGAGWRGCRLARGRPSGRGGGGGGLARAAARRGGAGAPGGGELAAAGRQLAVGCCVGADAAVLAAVPAASLRVFAAFGPGGAGACPVSAVAAVEAAATAGAAVAWWAGGGAAVPLRARLAARSRAVVAAAVPTPGRAPGLVAFLSSPASRGSLAACALAAASGFVVVAFPVAFPAACLPATLGGVPGVWAPVGAGALAGGLRFSSTLKALF